MRGALPPWVKRHGAEHDAAECKEFAAMTPEARWQVLAELSRLGARLLAANDRRDAVLELRDDRSPESIATWHRLMAQFRG